MSCNYDIGDKVVCVDDQFQPQVKLLYRDLPKRDQTYVVRDMRLGIGLDCKTGEVSVLLVGLINPPSKSKSQLERGFAGWRFAPLQEWRDKLKAVLHQTTSNPKELVQA